MAHDIKTSYDIGEELGSGSFATVKLATHKKSGQKYAVKIIEKARLAGNEDAIKKEVNILKQVEHPNIVCLKDIFESTKRYYLVMDLMTGGELFDRVVERGSYTERDAADVVIQMTSAIQYLHQRGIVHRDLKPENLLLASEEDDSPIKLADFGFAKFVGGDDAMTATACGTPGYVAPEVLKNKGYTKAVDLWSVGVITYILMCGFPPFYDENMADLFNQIMEGRFSYPSPYWDNISDGAKNLINNLLKVDASARFTCEQVLDDPWVKGALATDLTSSQEQLRKTLARKKFKKVARGIMAVNKIKNLTLG